MKKIIDYFRRKYLVCNNNIIVFFDFSKKYSVGKLNLG